MKFLKEFESLNEDWLSEEEVLDIKDMYIDIVDDLNLTDVKKADYDYEDEESYPCGNVYSVAPKIERYFLSA